MNKIKISAWICAKSFALTYGKSALSIAQMKFEKSVISGDKKKTLLWSDVSEAIVLIEEKNKLRKSDLN